jgi:single-strand DNA-binding protein
MDPESTDETGLPVLLHRVQRMRGYSVMALPRIHETGRLYAAPELRYTSSGKAVCTIPLVFSKRTKDRETGEWSDSGTLFVRGSVWDQMAENCAETLNKGDEVVVSGELSMREYERNDGSKGQSLEMTLNAIGPSLRWSTAKVAKAVRSGGDSGNSTPADDPWSRAPVGAGAADPDDPPPF